MLNEMCWNDERQAYVIHCPTYTIPKELSRKFNVREVKSFLANGTMTKIMRGDLFHYPNTTDDPSFTHL